MASLPSGDSWRPRDGGACSRGSVVKGRLASAGVIVVELLWLIDSAGFQWKAIPGT